MRKNKTEDIVETLSARELEVRPRAQANEYYIDISNKFKTAKFIVLIFLIVFILCMISVFRSDITLENCKYLIRFFSSTSTSYSGNYDAIYYDTEGVVDIDMFNSDLVTIKSNSVDFYNMNGSNTVSYPINYVNPTSVTGGKYMLIYDLGGNTFDLFNNFSQLYTQTFDYPISAAAVSNEGKYAVVTKSLDYQSVIYLYDHNFNLISKIFKDKYITDIKINNAGDEILVTSVVAQNGAYVSEIMTCSPYSDTPDSVLSLPGAFTVSCGYHSNGAYTVLTDSSLLFFDSGDNQISEFRLGNIVPTKCLILDDYVVLTYSKNIVGSQSAVLVFSTDGTKLWEISAQDKILDMTSYMEDVYLLLDGSVMSINMTDGTAKTAKLNGAASGIYVYDKNNIVISYSNMAKVYKVAELFEEVGKDTGGSQ